MLLHLPLHETLTGHKLLILQEFGASPADKNMSACKRTDSESPDHLKHPPGLIKVFVTQIHKHCLFEKNGNTFRGDFLVNSFPSITKTYLYKFDPLETPLLYSQIAVYRGNHVFFYYFCSNIYFGYSLETPRRGGSNDYPQAIF